jgi:hypothetical protein
MFRKTKHFLLSAVFIVLYNIEKGLRHNSHLCLLSFQFYVNIIDSKICFDFRRFESVSSFVFSDFELISIFEFISSLFQQAYQIP